MRSSDIVDQKSHWCLASYLLSLITRLRLPARRASVRPRSPYSGHAVWSLTCGLPVLVNAPQYCTISRASCRSAALNRGAIGVPLLNDGQM